MGRRSVGFFLAVSRLVFLLSLFFFRFFGSECGRAIVLVLLVFRAHLGGAGAKIGLRELHAVGRGIDRVFQDELVARHIGRLRLLDFLQVREHVAFGLYRRRHAQVDGELATQRVICNGIDRVDDLGVVLEQIVDQDGAAGFALSHQLVYLGDALFGENQIEFEAIVWFLDQSDLVGFVLCEKVASAR